MTYLKSAILPSIKCSRCLIETRNYYEDRPGRCKPCLNELSRLYLKRNPDKHKQYNQKYYQKTKSTKEYRLRKSKEYHLRKAKQA